MGLLSSTEQMNDLVKRKISSVKNTSESTSGSMYVKLKPAITYLDKKTEVGYASLFPNYQWP